MNPPKDLHPTGEMISAYVDGAAGPEERIRIEDHLRICPHCREMADDFRVLAIAAAHENPPPVPPDLAARIRRRWEEAGARQDPIGEPAWRNPVAWAAALVARTRRRLEELGGRSRETGPRGRPWRSPLALAAASLAVATLVYLAVRREVPAPRPSPPPDQAAEKSAARPPAPGTPLLAPPAGGVTPLAPGTGERRGDRPSPGKSGSGEFGAAAKAPGARGYIETGADEVESGMDERSRMQSLADEGKKQPAGEPATTAGKQEAAPMPEAVAGSLSAEDSRHKKSAPEASAVPAAAGRADEPAASSSPKGKSALPRDQAAPLAAVPGRQTVGSGGAPGPRTLLYETPDITVSLSEEGVVTLVQRGYACSVSVMTPETDARGASLPPELSSLFARATSREIQKTLPRAAVPAAPSPEAEAARPSTITLRGAEGAALYTVSYGDTPETAPPAPVMELEAEIRRAIGVHFRRNLELRCGPIPEDPGFQIP